MYSIPILDEVHNRTPSLMLELSPDQQAADFFRLADHLSQALAPDWFQPETSLSRGRGLLAAFTDLIELLHALCTYCEQTPLLWPASLRGERAAEILSTHFAHLTRRLCSVDEGTEHEWRALVQAHAAMYARLTDLYERLRRCQAAVGGICRRRPSGRCR